jgi:hypothetical protein
LRREGEADDGEDAMHDVHSSGLALHVCVGVEQKPDASADARYPVRQGSLDVVFTPDGHPSDGEPGTDC